MSFVNLLKQAAQNTAVQQAGLAQKEKARLAAALEAEAAAARKAAADKKAAEQRKKEREERERKFQEEQARRKAALPPTKNLYALKQERIKRGLNPDGSDDHLLGSKSTSKPSLGAPASKAGKTPSLSTKSTPKEKNTYVSREDKAARQRQAMFKDDDDDTSGSMALARAQKANGGGFSGSERGSASPRPSGSPRPSTNGGPSKSSSGSSSKPKSSLGRSSSTAKPANNGKASTANSAKDRLKAGFDPTSFIRLNTDKRDTRTIEEIEADMRRKRAGGASPKPDTKPSSSKEKTRASELNRPSGSGLSGRPSGSNSASTTAKRKPGQDDSRARDSPKRPKMDQQPSSSSNSKHRRRDSTSSEDSEDYDSDDSSDRGRRGGRGGGRGGYGLEPSTRDEIWQLMGRNRNRDVMRDEESDDDMEASGADVLREEQRAARLAAREDVEEQARLQAAAEKKRLAKLAKQSR